MSREAKIPRFEFEEVPKKTIEGIAAEIGELTARKNKEYGNSFAECEKILNVLYPNGIPVEAYRNALGIVRIIDKLFRLSRGNQGNESAWRDVCGYGLIAHFQEQEEK